MLPLQLQAALLGGALSYIRWSNESISSAGTVKVQRPWRVSNNTEHIPSKKQPDEKACQTSRTAFYSSERVALSRRVLDGPWWKVAFESHRETRFWWRAAAGRPADIGGMSSAVNLANNIRDIPSDTEAGKITLAVRLGDQKSRLLFTTLLLLPTVYTIIIAFGSWAALAGLAYFPFGDFQEVWALSSRQQEDDQ